MMRKVLFYRSILFEENEKEAAASHFDLVTNSVLDIRPGDLVVARYSMLPFYKDVEADIIKAGGRLLNTYAQHRYVADFWNWYEDLQDLTFPSWKSVSKAEESGYKGPFVIKGETNSKKFLWKTHMYAETPEEAVRVQNRLCDDTLTSEQKLVVRKYIELERILPDGEVIGPPCTNEHRAFFYKGFRLCNGYYWAQHWDEVIDRWEQCKLNIPCLDIPAFNLLMEIGYRVLDKCPFFVADIAKDTQGKWWLVELNDGQQSGLSLCSPHELYTNLLAST